MNQFCRNEALIGTDGQFKLASCSVLIAGAGGVGGYVLEMLARCGIGRFTIADMDTIEPTNLNRQIIALHSTLGKLKADAAKDRVKDINPNAEVNVITERITKENVSAILSDRKFDYCVDAIDSVKDKIELILACKRKEIPCISAMGAGNRLNVDFKVTDIFQTQNDGLAREVRRGLRKAGIERHKTVCCLSLPQVSAVPTASISYVPAIMGCVIAQEVIKELLSV